MKIEVSNGEIVDKLTILEIKKEKCLDNSKLENIQKELSYLKEVVDELDVSTEVINELRDINQKLWSIEDQIRECESKWRFGDDFIQLARSVYYTNDKRFEIKNKINSITNSNFKEEKILPIYV
jgi:hypothetical protein